MRTPEEIFRSIDEQYRHLWLNRKTGELALTTSAYDFRNGKKKTVEVDVRVEDRSYHSELKKFEKNWAYVCTGWGKK